MPHVVTMSPALSPIDKPVRGSVTPGNTGLKCFGRSPNQGITLLARVLPR